MNGIIVVGDLNLDIILSGFVEPPALGREILATDCVAKVGGSAANVAATLAAKDCPVRLFGRIGNDAAGQQVICSLEDYGVDASTIARTDADSTGLTVSLAYPKDRMLISHLGTVASTTLDDLRQGYIVKGAHLHLASYFLQAGLRPSIGPLLKTAKTAGMSTSLDLGDDPAGSWDIGGLEPFFQYLDWFMPNDAEIEAITSTRRIEDALQAVSQQIAGVVVKAGSNGIFTRYRQSIEHHPVPQDVSVVDTTCAGDCCNAGFLLGLWQGLDFERAIAQSNEYGGRAVACIGLPFTRSTV
jgi:sugar/nucleoside kinase (ribokinase family)